MELKSEIIDLCTKAITNATHHEVVNAVKMKNLTGLEGVYAALKAYDEASKPSKKNAQENSDPTTTIFDYLNATYSDPSNIKSNFLFKLNKNKTYIIVDLIHALTPSQYKSQTSQETVFKYLTDPSCFSEDIQNLASKASLQPYNEAVALSALTPSSEISKYVSNQSSLERAEHPLFRLHKMLLEKHIDENLLDKVTEKETSNEINWLFTVLNTYRNIEKRFSSTQASTLRPLLATTLEFVTPNIMADILGFYGQEPKPLKEELQKGVRFASKGDSITFFTHNITLNSMNGVASHLLDGKKFPKYNVNSDDLQYLLNCHAFIDADSIKDSIFYNKESKIEKPITTILDYAGIGKMHMGLITKLIDDMRVTVDAEDNGDAYEKELLVRVHNAISILYITANIQKIIVINDVKK